MKACGEGLAIPLNSFSVHLTTDPAHTPVDLYVASKNIDPPEHLRGHGLGSRLLRQAEEIAIANGCRYGYLSTFEYQARPFYERHGYSVFGTLADFPAGSELHYFYLRKDLRV